VGWWCPLISEGCLGLGRMAGECSDRIPGGLKMTECSRSSENLNYKLRKLIYEGFKGIVLGSVNAKMTMHDSQW